jgi:hypothetical protein
VDIETETPRSVVAFLDTINLKSPIEDLDQRVKAVHVPSLTSEVLKLHHKLGDKLESTIPDLFDENLVSSLQDLDKCMPEEEDLNVPSIPVPKESWPSIFLPPAFVPCDPFVCWDVSSKSEHIELSRDKTIAKKVSRLIRGSGEIVHQGYATVCCNNALEGVTCLKFLILSGKSIKIGVTFNKSRFDSAFSDFATGFAYSSSGTIQNNSNDNSQRFNESYGEGDRITMIYR